MEVARIISELRLERQQIDQEILSLEHLIGSSTEGAIASNAAPKSIRQPEVLCRIGILGHGR